MKPTNVIHSKSGSPFRVVVLCAAIVALLIAFPWTVKADDLAMLRVESSAASWGDVRLLPKLFDRLSGHNGLKVALLDDSLWQYNEAPNAFFDSKEVAALGQSQGARYVICFSAVRTELATRKGLSIPLILSRYNTVGVISGVLRIVDCKMGRLVYDHDFSVERHANSEWQPLESDQHSAALSIPAAEKPRFLDALEWQAAETLSEVVLKHTMKR